MEILPSSLTTPTPPSSGSTTPLIPKPKPLANFTRLNAQVSLYRPAGFPFADATTSSDAPTTIILCSWMNASAKHIAYYATHYATRYPQAQIIITTTTTKQFIFESEVRRRRDMVVAVDAILADPKPRILMHSFSNGGAKRAFNIAHVYRALTGGRVFAPTLLVFDSAPGMPRYRRDVHAISVPARRLPFLPWLLYMSLTCAVAALTHVATYWLPLPWWGNFVWGPMLGMRDPAVVGLRAGLGFVYSREDEAIDWRDVEAWAAAAARAGYAVRMRRVEGAEHVQMFRGKGGEEGYWGWVEQTWAAAVATSGGEDGA